MANCAGAILAGGKSTRMGRDKASLPLHGQTLLQHMQQLLSKATLETILISHPDFIADGLPEKGPLSGIHALLRDAENQHSHLLFIPVDMPCLTPAILKKLVNAPSDASLVHYADHKMPFRLSTEKQWTELAEKLLHSTEDMSLGNFQKHIQHPLILDESDLSPHAFRNINTADEWHHFSTEEAS